MAQPPWRSVLARARYALTQHQSRALILFYHGVEEVQSDPWRLHLPPARFAEQLAVIKQYATVLRLDELVRGLQTKTGKLPHRSIVVTFDDGYANNLTHALPLLKQHGVPATIFVASGYLGSEREFWSDELERLLLSPNRLPETLQLRINGHSPVWKLGVAAEYKAEESAQHRAWNAWQAATPSARHQVYRDLYQEMQPLPFGEQRRVLDELRAQLETAVPTRPLQRFLTADELRTLAQDELIEIGSHTVTHPLLPRLPVTEQEREICVSRRTLEEITERPVTSLAYPYGRYTAKTAEIARAAGMHCACAAEGTVAQTRTDLFRLPRCPVQDWGGEQFERMLTWWFRH